VKPLGSDNINGVNFAIAGVTATPGDTQFLLLLLLCQHKFSKRMPSVNEFDMFQFEHQ
jgi:hypothetical protein